MTSLPRRWASYIGLTLASLAPVGCKTPTSDVAPLQSWFDVQNAYARVLNKNLGTPNRFVVIPISGAVYPIGTVFLNTSPITEACLASDAEIRSQEVAPLPSMGNSNIFHMSASAPENWLKAIAFATAKTALTNEHAFSISYGSLKQKVVFEDSILRRLESVGCSNSLTSLSSASTLLLLRGLIEGSMQVSSKNGFSLVGGLEATNIAGLSLRYQAGKAFELADSTNLARFAIVSSVKVIRERRVAGLRRNGNSAGFGIVGGILQSKGELDLSRLDFPQVRDEASIAAWLNNYEEVELFTKDGAVWQMSTDRLRVFDYFTKRFKDIARVQVTGFPEFRLGEPDFLEAQKAFAR